MERQDDNSAKRIGIDNCLIPLTLGGFGWAVPRWATLALAYLAVVLLLGWNADAIGWEAATLAAQAGPAVIGGVDLIRRLRTTHYAWVNPAGGTTVSPAGWVDRLTLRECGWYFPLLALPLPLWFLGAAITVAALG